MRWCFASTRRARFRHWTALSPACLEERPRPDHAHDYKRNGTATLFAALDTASGEVYGLCQQRHRHQEWLRFLRMIDQTVPTDQQIYLLCVNYATHKHSKSGAGWIATSASMCASRLHRPRGST
jgi:hypothetical protein